MARRKRASEVGGVPVVLNEPSPTRFFRLTPLVAAAIGPAVVELLTDGVRVRVEGEDRRVTFADLVRDKVDPADQATHDGIVAAALSRLVRHIGELDPDDVDELCLTLLEGCAIGGKVVPEGNPAGARAFLDSDLNPLGGIGLIQIAGLQIWNWYVPTSPASTTGAPAFAGAGGAGS